MTSSLVGSEMCIRDRSRAAIHCWLTCSVESSEASGRESSDETESPNAVSYTHLTLPTICSV
eukprot:707295-Prorocentrum_lima.AAC.1